MKPLYSTLSAIERIAVIIGSVCLFVLMIIVTSDVAMRYLFHRPFVWTHDVISLYLMPTIFFLFLSDSMRAGAQVRVDILRDSFPPLLRSFADALGYLGAAIGFALIGFGGWQQSVHAFTHKEVVAGSIPWQVWPSFLLVALGCAMLVVRLLTATINGFVGLKSNEQNAGALTREEIE